MLRNRVSYLILAFAVIALGLFTRSSFLPEAIRAGFIVTYAGDTLWAAMIYLILCVMFPQWSALRIAIIALSFSYAVEISQLCQKDWLNHIRNTRIGALILGRGFL